MTMRRAAVRVPKQSTREGLKIVAAVVKAHCRGRTQTSHDLCHDGRRHCHDGCADQNFVDHARVKNERNLSQ